MFEQPFSSRSSFSSGQNNLNILNASLRLVVMVETSTRVPYKVYDAIKVLKEAKNLFFLVPSVSSASNFLFFTTSECTNNTIRHNPQEECDIEANTPAVFR